MSVVRIYDLAKELNMSNGELIELLKELGQAAKSASSTVSEDTVVEVKNAVASRTNGASASNHTPEPAPVPVASEPEPTVAAVPVDVPSVVSLREFAELIGVPASNIQKKLMGLGVLASLNQKLSPEVTTRLAKGYGVPVKIIATVAPPASPAPVVSSPVIAQVTAASPAVSSPSEPQEAAPKLNAKVSVVAPKPRQKIAGPVSRPPVVTIMGHVDHGKTTLLDTIRKTKVADGEFGGITQHIGAYQVEIDDPVNKGQKRKITFLDTPGHEAFTSMRARGAQVTDIAVLVVAADDGVMPQTIEAINHAKAAQVPLIVAINKIDKEDSNPTRVLTQLTEYDVMAEMYGGDVQTAEISAKQNLGIDALLEQIILVADAEVEPKADPTAPATGTVVEAELDRSRGVIATILVEQGTLKMGDSVVAGSSFGRIKAMLDDMGQKIKTAGPACPVVIVGLNSVPEAGERIEVVKDDKLARQLASNRHADMRDDKLNMRRAVTLEDLQKQFKSSTSKELTLIVRADTQGSVEAIRQTLEKIEHAEVSIRFISTAVGSVGESDVQLASASSALIVAFNVRVETESVKAAEAEHVEIRQYRVIYDLFDDVRKAMADLLDPVFEEAPLGTAEVRAVFKLPRAGGAIAGSYITDGKIIRGCGVRVKRGGKIVFEGKLDTLRREKDDAREVAQGYECGLLIPSYAPIEGDIIQAFEMKRIERTI